MGIRSISKHIHKVILFSLASLLSLSTTTSRVRAEVTFSQETYPKYVGHVNDFAGVIPADVERKIDMLCREVRQKTGAEIAVVTIETVGDEYYSEYANKLFETWGIGEKGKNNGVLLFYTVKERRVRLEVGYGLEGILPDGLAGEILDQYVIPYFRQADFGKGLLAGTRAIAGVIAKDAGVDITGTIQVEPTKRGSGFGGLIRIIIILLFIILLGGRGIFWPLLFGGMMMGGRGRRGPWGGFGGGSFGGGFGGFGGGLSGGGGAGRGF